MARPNVMSMRDMNSNRNNELLTRWEEMHASVPGSTSDSMFIRVEDISSVVLSEKQSDVEHYEDHIPVYLVDTEMSKEIDDSCGRFSPVISDGYVARFRFVVKTSQSGDLSFKLFEAKPILLFFTNVVRANGKVVPSQKINMRGFVTAIISRQFKDGVSYSCLEVAAHDYTMVSDRYLDSGESGGKVAYHFDYKTKRAEIIGSDLGQEEEKADLTANALDIE